MSTFLTGDALNDAIDSIIVNAKKCIYITSPYIKLDQHFKERFDLIKNDPSIYLQILFGKNEKDIYKSVKSEDLEYFKSFPNVSIIYEPRLHAKSYVNESEGVITSMNLYDYSAENNVEYGVAFGAKKLVESVYEDNTHEHMTLLEESAHCIYIKRPVFKKGMLGLSKSYLRSEVLLDIFDSFDPNNSNYERIVYQDIDVISLDDKETVPVLKSRSEKRKDSETKKPRERKASKSNSVSVKTKVKEQEAGFCIRTGEQIPFNSSQPLSKDAYKAWNKWKNVDFKEKYCHRTGQKSGGKTSLRHPILDSDYENEDVWN
jgi:hypothetical protein